MAGTAIFLMSDVAVLIKELETSNKYSPTMEDLFDPSLYRGGEVVDDKGNNSNHKNFGWPDASQLLTELVKPKLILAKDQGLYLLTNAARQGSEKPTVIYARGCNPNVDDDWYEQSRIIFGGDDGSCALEPNWYQISKDNKKRLFMLDLKDDQISLRC